MNFFKINFYSFLITERERRRERQIIIISFIFPQSTPSSLLHYLQQIVLNYSLEKLFVFNFTVVFRRVKNSSPPTHRTFRWVIHRRLSSGFLSCLGFLPASNGFLGKACFRFTSVFFSLHTYTCTSHPSSAFL